MKHRDLIIAAMDGKTIQWRYKKTIAMVHGAWAQFNSPESAVQTMCSPAHQLETQQCDFRIKPEPVPDKVFQTVAHFHEKGKDNCLILMAARQIKLTWKTDDNGAVTEYVEIVK